MKRITYKEIGKQAGVSISTVSRYFNNGYVGPEKHAAISEILLKNEKELNFCFLNEHNLSQLVYFVLTAWNNEEVYKIIQTVDDAIKINSSDVVLKVAPTPKAKKYIRHLKEIIIKKPRAIVLMDPPHSKELAQFLESLETSTVIISYGVKFDNINNITVNYDGIIQSLSKKLFEENRSRKIALLVDRKTSDNLTKELIYAFKLYSNKNAYESFVRSFDHRDVAKTKALLKDLASKNISNIICSNENVFQNLIIYNSDHFFKLSYIGYTDLYDYHNFHVTKSFIDYHYIWVLIENLIVNNEKTKNISVEGLTISSVMRMEKIEI